jgi:pimeloyl-ACP methyl ester carboxylesterase
MRLRSGLALLVLAGALLCWSSATPIMAAEKIGVVLMHGKTGSPHGPIRPLISKLRAAGILVDAPEMPWSRNRFLAKDYAGSMAEIDVAITRLKRHGAKKIVVAGHSMGGNAAIGYGARHDGLAGIIAIAPGHDPGHYGFQKRTNFDFNRAKAMVKRGEGEAYARFSDFNVGKQSKVRVKARIYLDWYDPDGPTALRANAAKLKPNTPYLCIFGSSDPLLRFERSNACDPAPKNPKSKFLLVKGGHTASPRTAASEIIKWLKAL